MGGLHIEFHQLFFAHIEHDNDHESPTLFPVHFPLLSLEDVHLLDLLNEPLQEYILIEVHNELFRVVADFQRFERSGCHFGYRTDVGIRLVSDHYFRIHDLSFFFLAGQRHQSSGGDE